jgi:hypothetical protein
MWAIGVACYHDIYLTSIDFQSDRMDKWDVSAMMSKYRTDRWATLSILSLVLPAVLCFVGPFVGALCSRVQARPAMLAGMTGAFFAILGFPAPLGALSAGDPLAAVAGVFVLIVFTLPFAAALGAAGGVAGAAIRARPFEPEPWRSFGFHREPSETALHDLVREAAIVREALDGSTHAMGASTVTLVFAWVQSAQALPESDRQTLADLGLDVAQLLPWLDRRSPRARKHIVQWLRHFEATVERGDGHAAYR